MNSSSLGIPIAIVVAGGLIAGAVFFSGNSSGGSGTQGGLMTTAMKIRTVSASEHIRGNADAKVAMVEYSDTECPFCKQFDGTMHQVISTYSPDQVAWVYRHLPLEQLHPKAPKEAEALECAAEQGGNDMFWKFADKVYATTPANNGLDIGVYNTPSPTPTGPDGKPYYTEKTPRSAKDAGQLSDFAVELGLDKAVFEECMASGRHQAKIDEDTTEAAGAGGNGTPFIIFVSKEKISKETKAALEALIPAVGPTTFTLSDDGYRISMSGALPFDMISSVLDTMVN